MYELRSEQPLGSSCKEPDWEKIYVTRKAEYEIISILQDSLIDFIKISPNAIRTHNQRSPIAEFLGTLAIDLIQRDRDLVELEDRIKEK
jgi:hypothetical protein